jgi:hypothetical protein
MCKEQPQGQIASRFRTDPCDQPHRQQRVTAKLKEAIIQTNDC